MQLVPVDDSNRQQVLNFLARYEMTCATLVENVRRKTEDIFAIKNENEIFCAVVGARHTLLHCIPSAGNRKESESLKPLIETLLHGRKISCINGEESGTLFLMHILASNGAQPASVNHYSLMIQKQEAPAPRTGILPSGWHILRCHEKDADALIDLQEAYEKEEVLPPCRMFIPAVVRQNLEHTLRSEYMLGLKTDKNVFAAKVNTNAIGINYVQIGGVYTVPEYRGRHYAALLISTLVHKIYAIQKRPVLFVKDSNEAARRLYISLGFEKSGNFVIAYF
jgi:ribosomal protein S18 acetylase RimI-like enzyme